MRVGESGESVGVLSGSLGERSPAPSLARGVADRLITAIAMGEYLPGSRLPAERRLSEVLGVGRVTVRAAIAELVGLGLVERKRGNGGGTFVVEPGSAEVSAAVEHALSATWDKLIDQYEAQTWMHGALAGAAARHRTEADVSLLHQRLEEYRMADSGEPSRNADSRLHAAIVDAAHNESLRELLASLEGRMHLSAPLHPWGAPEDWREMELRALSDHGRLVGAIVAGDVVAASEIGREHAYLNREQLERALDHARARSAALRRAAP